MNTLILLLIGAAITAQYPHYWSSAAMTYIAHFLDRTAEYFYPV